MPGLFFVCSTAVNTIRGEEPKTEPHLKSKSTQPAQGHRPEVPAYPRGDLRADKTGTPALLPVFRDLSPEEC